MIRVWSLWLALERIGEIGLVVAIGGLGKRCTGLVIGYIALSGIREQGENRGDFSG